MDPVAAHSCHLLQQLREQRIQGLLCDCMLVVRGVCFKAHKNVLAAFSQYFRSLFQKSSSQKNDVFHLDVKNVSGIGQILDFMYTSHLDLNQDNIYMMLDTAQCLQVQNVLNLCHTFLKSASTEQPPSMPCGGVFSLQSTLTPDACVVNEHSPPSSLQECSVEAQPAKALGDLHPPPSAGPQRSAEVSKQATEAGGGSSPELPCRQPTYCYKLRALYNKQHYKQAACSSHERATSQPLSFSASTDLATVDSQPSGDGHPECVLQSSEHLPSAFLTPPLRDSSIDPEADTCQLPTKQMRLKKAIHLKKLNLLKSQKSAEHTSHPTSDDESVRKVESAKEESGDRDSNQGPGQKGEEEQGPETFHCISREVEIPEAPTALEDQSQALQSQRQYACELCGKPFKHPSNLELHKRSHTGTQP